MMTKPHVPKAFIETSKPSNIVVDLRRQRKMRCSMRIDGIDSPFTLALVKHFSLGKA